MPPSNKRKIAPAIEEINFDPTARHEYLTGFHKRKLQRTKQAQEYAAKKAREEKREQRRKIREERAAEFQRILEDTEQRIRDTIEESDSDNPDNKPKDEEWEGFEEPPPVDYEAEYIDEDKYTTVTVEEMGLSREELQGEDAKRYSDDDEGDERSNPHESSSTDARKKFPNQKRPKQKKKKFRYESKAERKITARKERTGNRKKANARRER